MYEFLYFFFFISLRVGSCHQAVIYLFIWKDPSITSWKIMGSITAASFAELIFRINTDWVQNNLNCTVHCAQGHVCAYELIACVRVSLSTCHEGSAVITWRILAPAVEVVLSLDTSSKTKLTDWGGREGDTFQQNTVCDFCACLPHRNTSP